MLFACAGALRAHEASAWPGTAQAARSDWNAQTPPTNGWVDVTLPDDWSTRWPQFDGVVWYRLTWNQPEPVADIGLYIDDLTMAGVVSVNGQELARDEHLVEPLSRTWNRPRYYLLAPPLLRQGENTLLLRVSGFAAYQPGVGAVRLGSSDSMRALFHRADFLRRDLHLFGFAIVLTVGLFFTFLWIVRRREVAYGWFGAAELTWLGYEWNQLARTPWPFGTDGFEAFEIVALLIYCGCYMMFVLRFCERRWPRREAVLWSLVVLGSIALISAPHTAMRQTTTLLALGALSYHFAFDVLFVWFAWRGGRIDQRILSVCYMIAIAAAAHDMLAFLGIIDTMVFYATLSTIVTVLGVALVLAWNFARSLRRIESFNEELQHNVDDARAELAATLLRQHELELVHARLGERMNLAHDLHDGLGGMLIGTINELEDAPESVPTRDMLATFKDLRDDLRLIIDTATAQRYGELSLTHLLAPLRHRMSRLLDVRGIDSEWRLANLGDVYPTSSQSLDLLRILQEALANVLKHSRANRVSIDLRGDPDRLCLEICDNGVGFVPTQGDGAGTGMRSMGARAQRLGATLTIGSEPGSTVVRLNMPWPPG